MTERSSALFTNSQREGLLRGLSSGASDRKLRQRIRSRVRNSAVDLQLGFRRLDDEDLRRAFRANLEPIEDFRHELQDFSQGSRVFLSRLKEFDEDLKIILDSVSELEDSYYELTTLSMEIEDLSDRKDITEKEDEMRHLEQRLDSIVQSMVTDIEELEDSAEQLRALDEDSQARLRDLEERFEVFKVLLGDRVEGLEQWMNQFERRQRVIRRVVKKTDELLQAVHELAQTDRDQPEDWEDRINKISSIVRDLRDGAEDLRQWRNRRTHRRTAHLAFRDLSDLHFDPGMRDTVVNAIAFFLRAASVVGEDTERILEDAITTNIQTQQRDRVLDTVDVTIETEDREHALESADDKHSYEQFSNAELRALFESEEGRLDIVAERVRPSHQDLINRVLDEPSYVEEGLEITAMQVPIEYHDLEIHVDLIGQDVDGQLVLIDVIESASRENIERKGNQLEALLKEGEFGEGHPSRGLVIVDTVTEEAARQHTLDSATGDGVEVRQIK